MQRQKAHDFFAWRSDTGFIGIDSPPQGLFPNPNAECCIR